MVGRSSCSDGEALCRGGGGVGCPMGRSRKFSPPGPVDKSAACGGVLGGASFRGEPKKKNTMMRTAKAMALPLKSKTRLGSASNLFNQSEGGAGLLPAFVTPGPIARLRRSALTGVTVLTAFGGFVIIECAYPSRRAYLCDSRLRGGRYSPAWCWRMILLRRWL